MQKKYQIFISSTYNDLKDERDAVMKSCLLLGHIPIGMEMFNPADEEQWHAITRTIHSSDYYCIIVAQRYGSMLEGISYTEREYDYAVSIGIPILRFILDDKAPWVSTLAENDDLARQALNRFKSKLKTKIVAFWKNADDLQYRFAAALPQAINLHKRPGWIRLADGAYESALEEIARLSKENGDIKLQLETNSSGNQEKDLAEHMINRILTLNYIRQIDSASLAYETNYGFIFDMIAQKLPDEPSTNDMHYVFSELISLMVNETEVNIESTSLTETIDYYIKHGLIMKNRRRGRVDHSENFYVITDRGSRTLYYLERQLG